MNPRTPTLACGLLLAALAACAPSPRAQLEAQPASPVAPLPHRPPPLSSHVMTYHEGLGMVVMFGGTNPDRKPQDTLWGWDGSKWHVLAQGGPPPRLHSGLAYDSKRDRLVLFGGIRGRDDSLGDTWEWDGKSWRQRARSKGPGIRDHHAMAFDSARGVTILFGGQNENDEYVPETWSWDGRRWRVVAEDGPPVRSTHRLVYDPDNERVWLVGGWGPEGHIADVWYWDGQWHAQGRGPTARGASRVAYHQGRKQLVVFGGLVEGQAVSETWALRTGKWWQVGSEVPARNVHGMAYDAGRQRVVLYGGIGANRVRLDDVWEYDGVGWEEALHPTGVPGG